MSIAGGQQAFSVVQSNWQSEYSVEMLLISDNDEALTGDIMEVGDEPGAGCSLRCSRMIWFSPSVPVRSERVGLRYEVNSGEGAAGELLACHAPSPRRPSVAKGSRVLVRL